MVYFLWQLVWLLGGSRTAQIAVAVVVVSSSSRVYVCVFVFVCWCVSEFVVSVVGG